MYLLCSSSTIWSCSWALRVTCSNLICSSKGWSNRYNFTYHYIQIVRRKHLTKYYHCITGPQGHMNLLAERWLSPLPLLGWQHCSVWWTPETVHNSPSKPTKQLKFDRVTNQRQINSQKESRAFKQLPATKSRNNYFFSKTQESSISLH